MPWRVSKPACKSTTHKQGPHAQRSRHSLWPQFAAIHLAIADNKGLKELAAHWMEHFPWLSGSQDDEHPTKGDLESTKTWFEFNDAQDHAFFDLLDTDKDGFVTVEDLKACLAQSNLPAHYARDFVKRARGNRFWSNAINFAEFQAQAKERDAEILSAFLELKTDTKGRMDAANIQESLTKLGLPATADNATAMVAALMRLKGERSETDSGAGGATVRYAEFRRFCVLMPRGKLSRKHEPGILWFESATCMPLGGKSEEADNALAVLARAALAGGLASGLSTAALHPLDTFKTLVQSVEGATLGSAWRSVTRDLGARGVYRGVLPSVSGAASSHGIRTGGYEAGLMFFTGLGLPFMRAQPLAALVGTLVGTCVRIPCEVLKQQLQRGNYANLSAAWKGLLREAGPPALFRGAWPLLLREVPFYVFGMYLYEQLKRCTNGTYFGSSVRELRGLELTALGAAAAAGASFATTPFDVLKSRAMTAPPGASAAFHVLLKRLVQTEGLHALFKGALPRAVWIAPVGIMNFTGYEIMKKAIGVTSAGDDSAAASAAEPSQGGGEAPAPPAAAGAGASEGAGAYGLAAA